MSIIKLSARLKVYVTVHFHFQLNNSEKYRNSWKGRICVVVYVIEEELSWTNDGISNYFLCEGLHDKGQDKSTFVLRRRLDRNTACDLRDCGQVAQGLPPKSAMHQISSQSYLSHLQ
jgi:hypothetical protein